jgi:hypothetical protein
MTVKAARILQKMKLRRLFQNHRLREKVLEEFNRSTLDEVRPVGGEEQGMRVLLEMNSLADEHDALVKSLSPHVDVF